MEIRYLKEFVILSQTGNFQEAANILYSTQSTLSKHIKSLEDELGVSLFERTTRKVRISKYGTLFLPYAKQITETHEKWLATLRSNIETDQEVLNLGTIYGLAQYHITDVLINFKKSQPRSTLNVMQASSSELKEMLKQRKCEIAFIRDLEDPDDEFGCIPYSTDCIVAILPKNHPLAKHKKIPLKLLADENFLMALPDTLPYNLSMKACLLSGFEPKTSYTDHEFENHIDMVAGGMGVSLYFKKPALFLASRRTVIVDIMPGISTHISLCYLKTIQLSNVARRFMECADSLKATFDS